FRIRGRIQTQFGYVRAENDNTDGKEDWSTLEMRRVRLGVRGTLLQNVRAQLEANLVPGEDFSMRSAFLQWREYAPAYIKAGYDRPAFGFERTTSSASIYTVERSHITNTIISEDMTGVSLEGKYNVLSYGAGLYTNRANRNLDGLPSRYLYNASAGVTLDQFLPEEQRLMLRADVISNDDHAADALFGYETGLSVSAHYGWDRFDFRTEYLWAEDDEGDATAGWYVMPSYRVTPKWQAVARYERSDSDNPQGIRAPSRYARRAPNIGADGAQRGDDFQAIYLGAACYIISGLFWVFLRMPWEKKRTLGLAGRHGPFYAFHEIGDGLRYAWKKRVVRVLVLMSAVVWGGTAVYVPAVAALNVELYGQQIGTYGPLLGMVGLGMLLGAVGLAVCNPIRGLEVLMVGGFFLLALCLGLQAVVPVLAVGMVLSFGVGLSGALLMVPLHTLLQRVSANHV
ncbi:MAG: porin, partial [Phycisphaeraceae bacterium]